MKNSNIRSHSVLCIFSGTVLIIGVEGKGVPALQNLILYWNIQGTTSVNHAVATHSRASDLDVGVFLGLG